MDDDHAAKAGTLIDRLTGHWLRQGISLRPGASSKQIDAFESKYSVRLPPDLRAYFAAVDGMEEGETDSDLFSFLRLDAVKSIPEELAQFGGIPDYTGIIHSLADVHRWFVIVDYFICSAVCAIRLLAATEDAPVVCLSGGENYRVVAPSFSGFVEAYLTDPLGLLR